MSRAPRVLALVLLASVTMFAVGCSSNNKGKIEGKWKVVTLPGAADFEKASKDAQLTMFFEFEPNGTFALSFESPIQPVMAALKQQFGTTRFTAKYKLLSGDGIELYDFSPGPLQDAFKQQGGKQARSNIKISGDNMTMTDPDGKSGTLVRYKEQPATKPVAPVDNMHK